MKIQTFLPYPDFEKSARCLDYRRLGKQRVEAKQILDILLGNSDNRWKHHPCVRMWKGYEVALMKYYNCMLIEWERRGYQNIKLKRMEIEENKIVYPNFIGDEDFHRRHKSNLLRKNKVFYSKYHWKVSDDLPYKWE